MIARNGEAPTRRPSFMGRLPSQPQVEPAAFGGPAPRRSSTTSAASASEHPASPTVIDMQKLADEVSERIGSAAQFLRQAAERLAAEARSDALEVGFMVARRILETDLTANLEPHQAAALSRGCASGRGGAEAGRRAGHFVGGGCPDRSDCGCVLAAG